MTEEQFKQVTDRLDRMEKQLDSLTLYVAEHLKPTFASTFKTNNGFTYVNSRGEAVSSHYPNAMPVATTNTLGDRTD